MKQNITPYVKRAELEDKKQQRQIKIKEKEDQAKQRGENVSDPSFSTSLNESNLGG